MPEVGGGSGGPLSENFEKLDPFSRNLVSILVEIAGSGIDFNFQFYISIEFLWGHFMNVPSPLLNFWGTDPPNIIKTQNDLQHAATSDRQGRHNDIHFLPLFLRVTWAYHIQ